MGDVENQKPLPLAPKDAEEEAGWETEYQDISWRRFLSWRFIPVYLVIIAVIVLVILIAVDKNQIVSVRACIRPRFSSLTNTKMLPPVVAGETLVGYPGTPMAQKLTPIAEKIQAIPAGWLIPIAILIAVSIPPLFGHEIIALLCGIVYGLGIGFGIVAAGTFFGELLTWLIFKHALRTRARKLERTNLNYAALARLIRDGGFWIVVLVRLSVVPSHMSTAVFSTCGVKFWHFVVAIFLALPKQLVVVYLGTLLVGSSSDKVAKALVFVIGGALTAVASVYILRKLQANRKILLEEQAERKNKRANERQDVRIDTRGGSIAEPGPQIV